MRIPIALGCLIVAILWLVCGRPNSGSGEPPAAGGRFSEHLISNDKWIRANQVIVADLNGDKRPDIIACAERGSLDLRWWRNDGPGK
jgi:hypothetical protein